MLSKRSSWASQRVPASPAQSCAAGSLLFPSASFIALLPLWHQLKRVWKSAHRESPSPHRSPCTTPPVAPPLWHARSEEQTSELQTLQGISYAVFGLQKKKTTT